MLWGEESSVELFSAACWVIANLFMHQRGQCERDTKGEIDLDKHLASLHGRLKKVLLVHVAVARWNCTQDAVVANLIEVESDNGNKERECVEESRQREKQADTEWKRIRNTQRDKISQYMDRGVPPGFAHLHAELYLASWVGFCQSCLSTTGCVFHHLP